EVVRNLQHAREVSPGVAAHIENNARDISGFPQRGTDLPGNRSIEHGYAHVKIARRESAGADGGRDGDDMSFEHDLERASVAVDKADADQRSWFALQKAVIAEQASGAVGGGGADLLPD